MVFYTQLFYPLHSRQIYETSCLQREPAEEVEHRNAPPACHGGRRIGRGKNQAVQPLRPGLPRLHQLLCLQAYRREELRALPGEGRPETDLPGSREGRCHPDRIADLLRGHHRGDTVLPGAAGVPVLRVRSPAVHAFPQKDPDRVHLYGRGTGRDGEGDGLRPLHGPDRDGDDADLRVVRVALGHRHVPVRRLCKVHVHALRPGGKEEAPGGAVPERLRKGTRARCTAGPERKIGISVTGLAGLGPGTGRGGSSRSRRQRWWRSIARGTGSGTGRPRRIWPGSGGGKVAG